MDPAQTCIRDQVLRAAHVWILECNYTLEAQRPGGEPIQFVLHH